MSVTPQALQRAKADHRIVERLQQRVERLEQQVATLATKLAAVADKEQRYATTITDLVANVAQDIPVTWPEPWPDTAYGVWPKEITGTAATGKVAVSLKPASKTTTSCVITVVASQTVASAGLDVLGVRTF